MILSPVVLLAADKTEEKETTSVTEVKEEGMPPMPMMEEEGMPPMPEGGPMMKPRGMKGMFHRGKGKCDCPMMKASMVVAQDGGVIVLLGNKLSKYDADLNFVKEVEIKLPPMMGKQCPMMKDMMGGKAEEPKKQETASAPAPAEEAAPAAM